MYRPVGWRWNKKAEYLTFTKHLVKCFLFILTKSTAQHHSKDITIAIWQVMDKDSGKEGDKEGDLPIIRQEINGSSA